MTKTYGAQQKLANKIQSQPSFELNEQLLAVLENFVHSAQTVVPITKSILFGSQVTGKTHSDSDVDVLLISSNTNIKRQQLQLVLSDIAYDFLLNYDAHISPLVVSEKEWQSPNSFANPALLKNIRKTGIVL